MTTGQGATTMTEIGAIITEMMTEEEDIIAGIMMIGGMTILIGMIGGMIIRAMVKVADLHKGLMGMSRTVIKTGTIILNLSAHNKTINQTKTTTATPTATPPPKTAPQNNPEATSPPKTSDTPKRTNKPTKTGPSQSMLTKD